jgi:hypothetical protein
MNAMAKAVNIIGIVPPSDIIAALFLRHNVDETIKVS